MRVEPEFSKSSGRGAASFQDFDEIAAEKPAKPPRDFKRTILIVGLGAGCAAAFALGKLRSTFATTGGLEKATGLPVLGAVSQTVTDAARAIERKRLKYFAGASAALGVLFAILMAFEFIQRGTVA